MLICRKLILSGCLSAFMLVTPGVWSAANAQDAPAETEASEEGEQAEEAEEPEARPSEGPFVEALSRFSTILGSMHFLRELCGDKDKSVWRGEMNAFLEAQKPNEADRRRFVASFNSGYRAFASTYRHCTPAARLAHNRYQKEGAALSRDMLTRYGN
ncbi:TIGR02301 family protein [Fulvimarina sp. 2208YS6-2-32]|uniref:TIGR02301 family protein n=1 Tax=Fulvimarina uroteuthidis TaxID=3098149 RepID=A0ABU5I501_9HYPH|nr:TIGR02301 family protein [Fulvimarina sp. 2208YS6-2-32]MDY8110475.1 TIGR02301 family protein [Fulvimarina sp. 2208YS6-2-32]